MNVFTVIVTYNATPWIKKCIQSLLQSSINTKIIVVDNHSKDETLKYLEEFSIQLHLIKNDSNRGFGQANNQGLYMALENGADFIFLLNQDCFVFEDTIELLCHSLEHHREFGILSALQLQADGISVDQKMSAYIKKDHSQKFVEELTSTTKIQLQKPLPLRFVNAASWMISRHCLLATGLFHPAFYHYGEDNHYCSRAQYHGFKTGFLPAAKVIHDRKQEDTSTITALRKKLRTVPLYTLLDIRKPTAFALILGRQKLAATYQKLKRTGDTEARSLYREQKVWFTKKLSQSLDIRKQTKKKWRKT